MVALSLLFLSGDQKYQIFTNVDLKLNKYPSNSQKQRFQPHWRNSFPWIRYSISVDAVFCAPSFLFSKACNSEFVTIPFSNWKNATGTSCGALNHHSASHAHQECVEQAASFRSVVEKKAHSIKGQLSDAYNKQVEANTAALLAIVDSILFLVKQGLGLKSSNWDRTLQREDGNFSDLLHFLSRYSPELKSHIAHSPKNARYLSPQIQNEFIAINADIMADETTDISTKEQVSVCVCVCVRCVRNHYHESL